MQQPRIVRDFRQLAYSPAKFLAFCKRLVHSLNSCLNLPEAVLVLVKLLVGKVDILDPLYHQSLDRAKSVIRERDLLIHEIVVLLDQIASALESAFGQDSNALQATGFTVTQERRYTHRPKTPLTASNDFTVQNLGGRKAIGRSSRVPGGVLQEIHINMKDPAVEAYWSHNALYYDPSEMVIENLEPGNAFFRMRHHGLNGAGPWSAVVTITIT